MEKRSAADRRAFQEERRVELFAVSSVLADACVARARRERPKFPPYGLVLSRHTELRMVVANPGPVEAGAVDGFHALGKAFIDTTVWHLHGSLSELRVEGRGWMIDRLDDLLRLFKVGASPASRARMRDGVSFLYGGLHFGTAVCVQLAEVMNALLDAETSLTPAEKAAVMTRSSRPPYELAAYSVTEVLRAYQRLQSTTRRTVVGTASQSWLDPKHFVLRQSDGRPWMIDLRDQDLLSGAPPPPAEGLHELTTLGCPARISPTGSTSPIATLWAWCVELAHDTGLLGDVGQAETAPD
ncbi:MAG: hypothetical protein ACLGHC_10080 [Alphaproteobacteria bacterium]